MIRLKSLVLVVLLGMLSFGVVSGFYSVAVAAEEDVVKMGVLLDIRDFTPFETGSTQWPIALNVYDRLLQLDKAGNLTPMLVTSWEVRGNTISLQLRKGVKFHDGTDFTPEVFVKNIEFAQDPVTGYDNFMVATRIAKTTITGTYSVELTVEGTSPYWVLRQLVQFPIASPNSFPLHKTGIGTGPFKVESWSPGIELVLTKFEDYWQEGKPKTDKLIVSVYSDPRTLVNALKAGQIDWATPVPFEFAKELQQDSNFVVEDTSYSFYNVIYLNVGDPDSPFYNNKKLRQAMQYAIDREAYTELGFFGFGGPRVNAYWDASPYTVDNFEKLYYFDLDKAKQLIEEAGYDKDHPLEFTLTTSSGFPRFEPIAALLQEDLAKIGVAMTIEVQEPGTWATWLTKGLYTATLSFMEPNPLILFAGTAYRPDESNVPWAGNPPQDYVEIVNTLQTSLSEQEITATHIKAQIALLDESWSITLCTRPFVIAWAKYLKGVTWGTFNWPIAENVEIQK